MDLPRRRNACLEGRKRKKARDRERELCPFSFSVDEKKRNADVVAGGDIYRRSDKVRETGM